MAQDRFDLIVRGHAVLESAAGPAAPAPAAVGVRAGRIAAIGSVDADWAAREELRLAEDEVLLPGLVDTHVHLNEPGRTEWEGFASGTAAAAAGGVTTLLDMPLNSIPPTTTPAALAAKQQAARPQARVDIGFWGGAVPESLGRLEELWAAGVFGFKAFLSPSGVDEFGHLDAEQLRRAAAEIAGFEGLLIVHAEDPAVLAAHEHHGGPRFADFLASRPDEAELAAIGRVVDAVRETGVRAHILHLASAAALPLLAAAKAEGLPITAETCPHYLSFDAESVPDGATEFKCCPPIRSAANREQLWAGLAEGVIDFVASDHSPATAELKVGADGDFLRAWGGIAGVQLSLPAVWSGARARGFGLERVVGWLGSGPADFAGLHDRGRIAVGAPADLVRFAPSAEFTVHAASLQHRNPVSAFDGARLTGAVRGSWLRGTGIAADGQALGAPAGVLLRRGG